MMAGMELPIRAIREQVASAIHIIVQLMRFNDGTRRVVKVSEMVGLDKEGNYELLDVFEFKQEGVGEGGKAIGRVLPTGLVPMCFQELQESGISVNMGIFNREGK